VSAVTNIAKMSILKIIFIMLNVVEWNVVMLKVMAPCSLIDSNKVRECVEILKDIKLTF
jgi:hypothetical protein